MGKDIDWLILIGLCWVMGAAGSESDCAPMSCDGDAAWSGIQRHMAKLEPQKMMELFMFCFTAAAIVGLP